MRDLDEIRAIVDRIDFPAYTIQVNQDGQDDKGEPRFIMQGFYVDADTLTGLDAVQSTRKWIVSRFSTESEIVQTALSLLLMSREHYVREHFLYKGHRVMSPHFDINAALSKCEQAAFDERIRPIGPPSRYAHQGNRYDFETN
jgi:hypothetical protein